MYLYWTLHFVKMVSITQTILVVGYRLSFRFATLKMHQVVPIQIHHQYTILKLITTYRIQCLLIILPIEGNSEFTKLQIKAATVYHLGEVGDFQYQSKGIAFRIHLSLEMLQ